MYLLPTYFVWVTSKTNKFIQCFSNLRLLYGNFIKTIFHKQTFWLDLFFIQIYLFSKYVYRCLFLFFIRESIRSISILGLFARRLGIGSKYYLLQSGMIFGLVLQTSSYLMKDELIEILFDCYKLLAWD